MELNLHVLWVKGLSSGMFQALLDLSGLPDVALETQKGSKTWGNICRPGLMRGREALRKSNIATRPSNSFLRMTSVTSKLIVITGGTKGGLVMRRQDCS